MKTQRSISQKAYHSEGFIGKYQRLIADAVVPYQYSVLCDKAPDAEKSHVMQNFINAGNAVLGKDVNDGFYGMVFQDSDAAKWIEAAAYTVANFSDAELERTVDDFIDVIAAAQEKDGYLNTYYTIKDRDKRFKNLLEGHELYCAGHLMEAACAYYEATGKRKLLDVMHKNALHIYDHFITKQNEGYPGHPEIELALVKMYRYTGDIRCLELAKHFVDTRGVDKNFFRKERASRDWTIFGNNAEDDFYQQSDAPVREQTDVHGHAVRAVYLLTAMADLAAETEDTSLLEACNRLYDNLTNRRMYVTGAIGSTVIGEAFTVDYDLPNDTAYAETCASIGLIFFASKMLEIKPDGKYADVMERAFYNTVLAGMQLDGKNFFYVNPLEVIPGISQEAITHRHVLVKRPKWYACACCPPNVARLIASYGSYAYGESDEIAYCHLFAAGTVAFKNGTKLRCETEYPYGFTVRYTAEKGGRVAIRIPAWSKQTEFTLNQKHVCPTEANGYAYLTLNDGDVLTVTLDSAPRYVYPSAKIPALSGTACIMRGPLVYAFEGNDNQNDVLSLYLSRSPEMTVCDEIEGLNGAVGIEVAAYRIIQSDLLYCETEPSYAKTVAKAIPYYAWGNRGVNQMRVYLPLL